MMPFYVRKQVALLTPYLTNAHTILDFGCGNLSLAKGVKEMIPKTDITGVDVVDSGVRAKDIKFRTYDGRRLPFKQNSFDVTIVYHVLHHCTDPKASLTDVMRVTKKTILLVEPVVRNSIDLFFMKILDRVGNGWRGVSIPMPFTFQKEETWAKWVREYKWNVQTVEQAGVFPSWFPIGVTKLFVLTPLHGKSFVLPE